MGKRLALVVGVGNYGEGFELLPGSLRDLQAMEAVLKNPNYGAFEVQSLSDCDRSTLETQIEQFFRGKDPADLLLFYFSGHGDLGSGGMLHHQLHLCTQNTRKEQGRVVESSAVSTSFLKRQMDLSRAQQIVVILDCCYSGAIADLLKKGAGEIDFGELKARGRVILASSSAAKVSLQAVDGLSLYTRYLIEGMTGAAYSGQGAWIAARDLHTYAERRFEIENKGYPPKIIAEETSFNLPVVRRPKPDPKLDYRKAVDQIFRELDQEMNLDFNGEITDDLDRGSLETRRQRLGLTEEEAEAIEKEVQQPYLVRATQRRSYADYFKKACKEGSLPNDRARRRLAEIRENLLLGEADAAQIEQRLVQQLKYQKLEELLKTQQWIEADQETFRLMKTAMRKEESQFLKKEELLIFSCEDLKAIDSLWVKYSQGRFGFSIQKQIYVECGAKLDGKYPGDEIWKKFGDRVGWCKDNNWLNYSDLNPSLSSPQGIFPLFCLRRVLFSSLAQRLVNCSTTQS